MSGPWREPDEETVDLYPGLVVHDGRHSGSITIGRSRLPLQAIVPAAILDGWDAVEVGWSPTEHYGFTARHLVDFLACLLEQRGEFARLILMLADVERCEDELEDASFGAAVAAGSMVEEAPGVFVGRRELQMWWEVPDLVGPLVAQLRRCIAVLEQEASDG